MVTYLSVMDVIAINGALLELTSQQQVITNHAHLEAAVVRPQMHAHYAQADVVAQAAALIVGIVLAHAFLDGNKRTALAAGIIFLDLNGLQIERRSLEVALQVEAVITRHGSLEEATEDFVRWLRPRVVPL
jgi:death on curing protein